MVVANGNNNSDLRRGVEAGRGRSIARGRSGGIGRQRQPEAGKGRQRQAEPRRKAGRGEHITRSMPRSAL